MYCVHSICCFHFFRFLFFECFHFFDVSIYFFQYLPIALISPLFGLSICSKTNSAAVALRVFGALPLLWLTPGALCVGYVCAGIGSSPSQESVNRSSVTAVSYVSSFFDCISTQ